MHLQAGTEVMCCSAQVDELTEFEPQVRGEIGAFGWHFVSSLPASEEAALQYNTAEGAKHKFYQVAAWAGHRLDWALQQIFSGALACLSWKGSGGEGCTRVRQVAPYVSQLRRFIKRRRAAKGAKKKPGRKAEAPAAAAAPATTAAAPAPAAAAAEPPPAAAPTQQVQVLKGHLLYKAACMQQGTPCVQPPGLTPLVLCPGRSEPASRAGLAQLQV